MIPLNIQRDANGSLLTNIVNPSDHINHVMLAANTNETLDVPDGAKYAIFQSDDVFFVKLNSAAAVPTADVKDGTGSLPIPVGIILKDTDTINMISSRATRVSVLFYS